MKVLLFGEMPLSGAVLVLFACKLAGSGLCRKGPVLPFPGSGSVTDTPGGLQGMWGGLWGVFVLLALLLLPWSCQLLLGSTEAGEDLQDEQVQPVTKPHTPTQPQDQVCDFCDFLRNPRLFCVLAVGWEPSRAPEGAPRCSLLADPRILPHVLC